MLRTIDDEWDPLGLPLIHNYSTLQSLPLEQALEPIIPRINQLDQYIQTAKVKCHFPSEHGLTLDESAAIFLYTMEWDNTSLYQVMKRDVHSKDQSTFSSWFSYLKLFTTAVQKLPSSRMNVWRGVNKDSISRFTKDEEFIWWNITSCSTSDAIIKDCLRPNSLLCKIETVNGKDISIYSNFPNQNEIILCPGTRLHVVSNAQEQTSSSIVHLRENNEQLPPSFINKGIIKIILLRCCTSRILSLMSHIVVLIIALLLISVVGKSYIIFESSKSSIDDTTVGGRPSTFHTHVDTYENRYEGELKDDKKHGKGKMNFANGYEYLGDWVDDTPSGEGIYIWTNGDRYEGYFENGQRHGKGSYFFANGDRYIGDWVKDKKSGNGISTLALGKYEGQFNDDKMHGKGTFYFANGDTYIGDWVDDKQEGEGIFNWANGDRFEGGFKAGKIHGKGSYYFSNGNKFEGDWIDGNQVNDHGFITWGKNAQRPRNFPYGKKQKRP